MSGARVRDRLVGSASRREWLVLAGLVVVEGVLVAGYFLGSPSRLTSVRYALYPLVWITVGLWAVLLTDPPSVGRRGWLLALGVAVAYLSTLLVLSGLVRVYGPAGAPVPTGVSVGMASPGWGPRVTLVAERFHAVFVPYRVVGYLALTYLVYARTAEAVGALAASTVGLLSCLGCTFPVLSSLAAGVVGTGAVASGVAAVSVDVSTGVFVLVVGLLYWWPAVGE